MRWPVALVGILCAASLFADAPLKVGVYCGAGPSGIGAVEWVRLVRDCPQMALSLVDDKDVGAGVLDGLDLLVMPGGGSKQEFRSLGTNGVARLRGFIRNGGGYFGTCAGCCLLMDGDERVRLFPWNTCGSEADLFYCRFKVNAEGARELGISEGDHVIRYHGGPFMWPTTNVIAGADFKVWATFDSEATFRGELKKSKRMFGAAAMLGGTYGKGRVFVTSAHPEYFESTHYIVKAAFKWLTGREMTFKVRQRRPRAIAVGVMTGGIPKRVVKVIDAIDADPELDLVPINRDGMFIGDLQHVEALVFTGGFPRKNDKKSAATREAVEKFLARGGRAFVLGGEGKKPLPEGAVRCPAENLISEIRKL